jgi:hypothetical protein
LRLENSNYDAYGNDIWIEGVGSLRGITYHSTQQISGVHQLKDCYESDELIFTNENPFFCFIGQRTEINYTNSNDNKVYVILNGTNLHMVNAENMPLDFYTIQGIYVKTIIPDSNNYQIDISDWKNGLYVIRNKSHNLKLKMLKQ